MTELTKEYIDNLKKIIEEKDDVKARELLKDLYPADIAEIYQKLDLQEAIYLYMLMDGEQAADVLMELDEEDRHKLLKELPNELIAKRFVDNMETDDAVDLMRELDEDTQEEILSHIEDVEQAGDIVDLLKYDEDTAGGLMGTEMIVVNENWSMPKCIDEMRKQAEEVDEIHYNSFGEAELSIGGIKVELGDSSEINGKIAELRDILPELEGLSGTLYLDTYDAANSSPTYTFRKEPQES